MMHWGAISQPRVSLLGWPHTAGCLQSGDASGLSYRDRRDAGPAGAWRRPAFLCDRVSKGLGWEDEEDRLQGARGGIWGLPGSQELEAEQGMYSAEGPCVWCCHSCPEKPAMQSSHVEEGEEVLGLTSSHLLHECAGKSLWNGSDAAVLAPPCSVR